MMNVPFPPFGASRIRPATVFSRSSLNLRAGWRKKSGRRVFRNYCFATSSCVSATFEGGLS